MEKLTEILTSPVWWSTIIALLGVVFGLKLFIEKIQREDKAIEDQRREQQALKDENVQ